MVDFECSGNVGRPPGYLLFSRATHAYPDMFYKSEIVKMNDLTENGLTELNNGTFRVQYSFTVNLTRYENGTNFRCEVLPDSYFPAYMKSVTSNIRSFNVNCKYIYQCHFMYKLLLVSAIVLSFQSCFRRSSSGVLQPTFREQLMTVKRPVVYTIIDAYCVLKRVSLLYLKVLITIFFLKKYYFFNEPIFIYF